MGKEPIIEVRHMVKNFGPTRALRDVDVSFYRGEIRGLLTRIRKKQTAV